MESRFAQGACTAHGSFDGRKIFALRSNSGQPEHCDKEALCQQVRILFFGERVREMGKLAERAKSGPRGRWVYSLGIQDRKR